MGNSPSKKSRRICHTTCEEVRSTSTATRITANDAVIYVRDGCRVVTPKYSLQGLLGRALSRWLRLNLRRSVVSYHSTKSTLTQTDGFIESLPCLTSVFSSYPARSDFPAPGSRSLSSTHGEVFYNTEVRVSTCLLSSVETSNLIMRFACK